MKLQKILYFVAAEYQKTTSQSLFSERFETWQYGPVLRSVYSEFRPFSRDYITRFAKDAENKSRMINEGADPALQGALDSVWAATKGRSAVDLSRITHVEDSAWDKSFQNEWPFLSSENIASDDTYRLELGLATA
ncbi:Panacea domain-containing protein [Corynebacterium confusum]